MNTIPNKVYEVKLNIRNGLIIFIENSSFTLISKVIICLYNFYGNIYICVSLFTCVCVCMHAYV